MNPIARAATALLAFSALALAAGDDPRAGAEAAPGAAVAQFQFARMVYAD
jgi:hypothetical protein